MPLTKFICPDKEEIDVNQCIAKCRMVERCLALPTLVAIVKNERKWVGIPSITQLQNGTRMSYLKIKEDYSANPRGFTFALLGSTHHALLEDAAKDLLGLTTEERVTHDGISGQQDLLTLNSDGTYTITDYKTYGSYAVARLLGLIMESRPTNEVYKRSGKGFKAGDPKKKKVPVFNILAKDDKKEIFQLNGYRWLYENALGIKISRLELQVTVRDGGTQAARSRGIDKNIYYPVVVPIIPDTVVEEYFGTKRDNLLQYLDQNNLPPVCNDEENWSGRRCVGYCEVVKFCPEGSALKYDAEMKGKK